MLIGCVQFIFCATSLAVTRTELDLAETPEYFSQAKQFELATRLVAKLSPQVAPELILDTVKLQAAAWIDVGLADKLPPLFAAAEELASVSGDRMRLATMKHLAARARFFSGEDRASIPAAKQAIAMQLSISAEPLKHPDPSRLFHQLTDHIDMLMAVSLDAETVPHLRLAEQLLPLTRQSERNSIWLHFSNAGLRLAFGERDAALAHLNDAQKIATEFNDRGWLVEIYGAQAAAYLDQAMIAESIVAATQQRALANKENHALAKASSSLFLADAHFANYDLATAYTFAVEAKHYFDRLDDTFHKADARRALAMIEAGRGNIANARKFLAEALQVRAEDTSLGWRLAISKAKTAIAISTGDADAALRAKAEEDRIANLKLSADTTRLANTLREYHGVTERELSMKLLQSERDAQELKLKRDESQIFWQNVAIAASALLLLALFAVAILLYRRSRTLKQTVDTDSLTGVSSRAAILSTAHQEFTQAARHASPLAVCVIDIDHFKRFNDDHGHDVGDQVLLECVKVIKQCISASDYLGRIGGDELLVVMPNTDATAALNTANRIVVAARNHTFDAGGTRSSIHLSAGVAAAKPTNGITAKQLIQRADAALLLAKRAGKDRVVFDGDADGLA